MGNFERSLVLSRICWLGKMMEMHFNVIKAGVMNK
jgi:hypothetical protein